ncbi:MAG: flavodoxin family protein [Armatimonadetes bacterium]|nr:flavodoxin family protein [Armatimonadota bacterium]
MKILAINATSRPRGTTTCLTESALEGASAAGAETEMLLLRDFDIKFCRNCLACYYNQEPEIAPCGLDDDMTMILEKVVEADGVLFASPVHCGFVSGLMVVFMERAVWRLCRPTGRALGLGGIPEPRAVGKARAVATIVSAGGIPPKLRRFCDLGTPWLKEQAGLICNGQPVGDMYAGAIYSRQPQADDWRKLYSLRKLTREQLQQARDLGSRMAEAIRHNKVQPYRLAVPGGKLTELAMEIYSRLAHPIEVLKDADLPPA